MWSNDFAATGDLKHHLRTPFLRVSLAGGAKIRFVLWTNEEFWSPICSPLSIDEAERGERSRDTAMDTVSLSRIYSDGMELLSQMR